MHALIEAGLKGEVLSYFSNPVLLAAVLLLLVVVLLIIPSRGAATEHAR